MKPRIGVTTTLQYPTDHGRPTYTLHKPYVDAIVAAGGLPVLIPCTEEFDEHIVHVIDGLLIPGGVDVDPIHYGEEPDAALGKIDPLGDYFELAICRKFLDLNRPVLGICRGMQLLNVAAGGSLYQDIPVQTGSRLQHRQQAPMNYATHAVDIVQDSRLRRIVWRESLRVNSSHHQAVKKPAPGFKVSASASDGIAEAIERDGDALMIGVQWHPERMTDDPQAKALFDAFVAAASKGSSQKEVASKGKDGADA